MRPGSIRDHLLGLPVKFNMIDVSNMLIPAVSHHICFDKGQFLRFINTHADVAMPRVLVIEDLADLQILQDNCPKILGQASIVVVNRQDAAEHIDSGRILSRIPNVRYCFITDRKSDILNLPLCVSEFSYVKPFNHHLGFNMEDLCYLPSKLVELDISVCFDGKVFKPDLPITLQKMSIRFELETAEDEYDLCLDDAIQIDLLYLNNLTLLHLLGMNSFNFEGLKVSPNLTQLLIKSQYITNDWTPLSQFIKLKRFIIAGEIEGCDIRTKFPTLLESLFVRVPFARIPYSDLPRGLKAVSLCQNGPSELEFMRLPETLKYFYSEEANPKDSWINRQLPDLEELVIESSRLEGLKLPTTLKHLCLSNSSASYVQGLQFTKCQNLVDLNLSYLNLESFECIELPPSIKRLDLTGNKLQSIFLEHCPNLEQLYLSKNQFRYLSSSNFGLPQGLKEIHLSELPLDEECFFSQIGHDAQYNTLFPASLELLNLIGSIITSNILSELKLQTTSPNLKQLYLSHNEITEINSFELPSSLIYLDISNNPISHIREGDFSEFKNLKGIDMKNNQDLGICLHNKTLKFPKSLQLLNLSNCGIVDLGNIRIWDYGGDLQWIFLDQNYIRNGLDMFLEQIKQTCPLIAIVEVNDVMKGCWKSKYQFLEYGPTKR
ncbi:PODN [[Candida] subhashii]|uniref:PODN n=1 Tax=[Candida] subhashii TaxID=561895 RepID=A0A8J5QSJ2_9ASCO|nr:PODN [[Candida] subhashii]KAG7665831.1 PODN [[Candida] subhashii]